MAKGTLVGSHEISTRSCPWDPINDGVLKDLKKGDTVTVDTSQTVYDWQGHEFYPFIDGGHQNGYIRKDAVQLNALTTVRRAKRGR